MLPIGRYELRRIKGPQDVFTVPDTSMARAMDDLWRGLETSAAGMNGAVATSSPPEAGDYKPR